MVPSNPTRTGEHSVQSVLPALSVPLAEALSSTAIGALIRLLGLPDMFAQAQALSLRYEGMAFQPNAPHQLTALSFVKKALRNLSKAFSFF